MVRAINLFAAMGIGSMKQYVVDVFTVEPFKGNPAAVCVMDAWPSGEWMQKLGIPEDPVCGSAHCQISDYWAQRLGKGEISAYQASPRSGVLTCRLINRDHIAIGGTATLIASAELAIQPF